MRRLWVGVTGAVLTIAGAGLLLHLASLDPVSPARHGALHVPAWIELDQVQSEVEFPIRVENRSARELEVRVGGVSCGCLSTQVRTVTVAPRSVEEVPFVFRPGGIRGTKSYRVQFLLVERLPDGHTRTSPGGTTKVKVDARPLLSVEPRVLLVPPPGAEAHRRIPAMAHVPRGAELRGLRFDSSHPDVRIAAGSGGSFDVLVAPEAYLVGGVHRVHVHAEVNGTLVSDVLKVHLQQGEACFWVAGGRILLGYARGDHLDRAVHIRHSLGTLNKRDVRVRLEGVEGEVTVQRVSANTIHLRIKLRRPTSDSGRVAGAVHVSSAGHPDPVPVPLVGYWS